MNPIIYIALLALTASDQPNVITENVPLIELNHFYSHKGAQRHARHGRPPLDRPRRIRWLRGPVVETWTQYDPELTERQRRPKAQRRGLRK